MTQSRRPGERFDLHGADDAHIYTISARFCDRTWWLMWAAHHPKNAHQYLSANGGHVQAFPQILHVICVCGNKIFRQYFRHSLHACTQPNRTTKWQVNLCVYPRRDVQEKTCGCSKFPQKPLNARNKRHATTSIEHVIKHPKTCGITIIIHIRRARVCKKTLISLFGCAVEYAWRLECARGFHLLICWYIGL